MYLKNITLVNAYKSQIPDLESKISSEFKDELESGILQSIKISQNKGNLVVAEYEYLRGKTKTANKQKEEELNFRIRTAVDKLHKESFN